MFERLQKIAIILMLIIAVVCYFGLFFDADEIDWWVSGTFTAETILGLLVIILNILNEIWKKRLLMKKR